MIVAINAVDELKKHHHRADASMMTVAQVKALTADQLEKLFPGIDNYMLYCWKVPTGKFGDDTNGVVSVAKQICPNSFISFFANAIANTLRAIVDTDDYVKEKAILKGLKGNPKEGKKAEKAMLLEVEAPFKKGYKWPSSTVPFCWGPSTKWKIETMFDIWIGLRWLIAKTNLRFIHVGCDAPGHKVILNYEADTASTTVGYTGGSDTAPAGTPEAKKKPSTTQDLSFDGGAFNGMSAAHEMLHACGFSHVQNRHDRDKYIIVDVDKRANVNFAKKDNSWEMKGPFCWESIMLYRPASGYSIKPKNDGKSVGQTKYAGQRAFFPNCDVTMINGVYDTKGTVPSV
jgi:hypothetical protein